MFRISAGITLSLAILAGCASPYVDSQAIKPGDVYQNKFGVGYVQVPLPKGEWVVASTSVTPNNDGTPISTVYLIHQVGDTLGGEIIIDTNLRATGDGWAYFRQCERKDVHYVKKLANYDGTNQDCYLVNHISTYFPDESLKKFVVQRNLKMPPFVLDAEFRVADPAKFLTVQYYFNPDLAGIPPATGDWSTSAWNTNKVYMHPRRKAYVNWTILWADAWHSRVVDGFNGDLGVATAASRENRSASR